MKFKRMSNEDLLEDLIDRTLVYTVNNPNATYEDFEESIRDYTTEILRRMSESNPVREFNGFVVVDKETGNIIAENDRFFIDQDGVVLMFNMKDADYVELGDQYYEVRFK